MSTPGEAGWPAADRRTPADECRSCLEHTDDPPRLPAAEVLADAVAVLRQLADEATPGHRSYVKYMRTCRIDGQPGLVDIYGEGNRARWAAFGPDEARLLADLLDAAGVAEPIDHTEPPRNPKDLRVVLAALYLAHALTGHQRGEETR
jgi:hypothetical protein